MLESRQRKTPTSTISNVNHLINLYIYVKTLSSMQTMKPNILMHWSGSKNPQVKIAKQSGDQRFWTDISIKSI